MGESVGVLVGQSVSERLVGWKFVRLLGLLVSRSASSSVVGSFH